MMKMSNFRWKVAWLIFIVSFVSYMDRVNLSVATPVIMKEYGFDKIDMGLIQSFFFAGMFINKSFQYFRSIVRRILSFIA
jgi:MFS transporter, ACS family, glucarate transporter